MKKLKKNIENGRMLKSNGSWMYCNKCNNTIGYLVYSTYQNFKFDFTCKCKNEGKFELDYKTERVVECSNNILIKKKNRLCCPNDGAPLFSVVEKNLKRYSYEVTCKKCLNRYFK